MKSDRFGLFCYCSSKDCQRRILFKVSSPIVSTLQIKCDILFYHQDFVTAFNFFVQIKVLETVTILLYSFKTRHTLVISVPINFSGKDKTDEKDTQESLQVKLLYLGI